MHPFDAYFTKNWDGCRDLWCSYTRQNAVTLGNDTNNRHESSWKQLKEVVDPFSSVDEVIASILYYQSLVERDFELRVNKLAVVRNATYDSEMSRVANLVSQHAAEPIYEEYVYATTRAHYSYYEGLPNVYFIKNTLTEGDARDEPNVEYTADKIGWSCLCLFMSTRLLPCRHVFYLRKTLALEHVIPTHLLNARWLISSARNAEPVVLQSTEPFRIDEAVPRSPTAWNRNRKFREAKEVATSICDWMSDLGMKEYRQALSALERVKDLFAERWHSDVRVSLSALAGSDKGSDDSVASASCSEALQDDDDDSEDGESVTQHTGEVDCAQAVPVTQPTDGGEPLGSVTDVAESVQSQSVTKPTDGVESVQAETVAQPTGGKQHDEEEKESEPTQLHSDCRANDSGIVIEELQPLSTQEIVSSMSISTAEELASMALEDTDCSNFVIASPPRPRGRPRTTSKQKKAKKRGE